MSLFSKALDGLNRHNDRTRIKVIAMEVPQLIAEGRRAEACVLMNEATSLLQKLKVYDALGGLDQRTINSLVEINEYLHNSDEYYDRKKKKMGIFSSLFGGNKKVDKYALIRALAAKRAKEDPVMSAFGFEEEIWSMAKMQLLGLPEANIVGIVETYMALKRKGVDDFEIIRRIEAHRCNVALGGVPGEALPEPLTLRSYIKYRVELEMREFHPVGEHFIDYAMDAAWQAYTQ